MSRTRQVFPRDTVAHYWAHGIQDSARDAGHSFYFSGATLYSYGQHFVIGHVLRGAEYGELSGRVIWNDSSYSNTTSKHQSIAWRALTRQQCNSALHVPDLNADSARAIDRAIGEKRLPDYATGLIRRVQSDVASIIGKRHGSGPFCGALHSARKYDETARALFAAAGKKYPLDVIPDNDAIPADKTGRAAFVAAFSRAIIIDDYRRAIESASQYLKTARDGASDDGTAYTEPRTLARVMGGTYDCAERGLRACDDADKHYRTLHAGKASPQAGKLRKALAPIAAEFKARRDAAEIQIVRASLEHFARRYYAAIHNARAQNGQARRLRILDLPGYADKLTREWAQVGTDAESTIGRAVARVSRMDAARLIDRAAESARSSFASAESYGTQWPADAMRNYSEVSTYARRIQEHGKLTRYAEFVLRGLAPIVETARVRAVEMLTAVQEKEKARIADWISGVSNIAPSYTAGTFARVRGSVVETSRGASVPIEHACRLARVFDRIVSAGGREWADGAGPMVGHYRVNSIGADGSLTIGCHAFDPTEARRLRDVMASCAECQSVTVAEGV